MCWSEKGESKVLDKFYMQKMRSITAEVVEQEDKLCDEVETAREVR